MRHSQIKIGSLLSYLQMGLNICIGLVYTPLMIRLLGQSEYGLYNTVASTISMLSILNLGFNSGYIKYYSRYKKEKDTISIYKLNGLYIVIFSIIGLVALLCGGFLSLNLDVVFNEGLTQEELNTARVLMILLTINLGFSFPMSVFSTIISANERFIFLKLLGMFKTVASPLITIPLLLSGNGSVAIVSVTLFVSLFVDGCYCFYVIFVLKNKFIFHSFENHIFRELLLYTSFIAINIIVDQINWNIDKVLLGRFKGTVTVAIYSVGAVLQHYYNMFSTAISGVFTPRIHHLINANDSNTERNKIITDLFIKVGRIQFIILALICSGLIIFGKQFISFWAGDGYKESYYVALLLIIPVSVPLIQNLGIEIQRALNKHSFRSIVYGMMAIINLGMTIILAQMYGAIGAAIGTAISLVIANGIIMNIYYHKHCGINIIFFWRNILGMTKGLIIPIVFGYFFCRITDTYKFSFLLLGIAAYCFVYGLSMWNFAMNEEEKDLILKPIHRIIKKFS